MIDSAISWTDDTLNLWWGCEKVAQTCKNCYAAELANRYHKDLDLWKVGGPRLLVKSWRKNLEKMAREAEKTGTVRDVFCMSMGDIFEEDRQLIDSKGTVIGTTLGVRKEFFDLIPTFEGKLRFLLLTQRPENINGILPEWWKQNPPFLRIISASIFSSTAASSLLLLMSLYSKRNSSRNLDNSFAVFIGVFTVLAEFCCKKKRASTPAF